MEVSASVEQPNPSSGARLLAGVLDARRRASGPAAPAPRARWTARTGRPPARSTSWRTSTRCPSTPGRCTAAPTPAARATRPTGLGSGLQACSGCQTGYNTYSVIVNRTNTSDESITWYLNGTAYYTVTESQVGTADLAGRGRPRLLPDPGRRHGRRVPERRLRLLLADVLDQFRRVDERRLRRGLPDRRRQQHVVAARPAGASVANARRPARTCQTTATADISADCYTASQGSDPRHRGHRRQQPVRRRRQPGRPARPTATTWSIRASTSAPGPASSTRESPPGPPEE